MSLFSTPRGRAVVLAVLASGAIGYGVARWNAPAVSSTAANAPAKKILYYYDPMVPLEHYDNPGTLSSMGMKTVPRYADSDQAAGGTPGVKIDPATAQNFGMRVVTVTRGALSQGLTVTGVIDFNQMPAAGNDRT